MKLTYAVLLGVSLSALTVTAQTSSQQQAPAPSFGAAGMEGLGQQTNHIIVLHAARQSFDGCPVSLHAGHLADGSMVQTNNAHPRGLGQWLSLSLTSFEQKQIASATLVVHGIKPKPRMSEALAADNGKADTVATFHVSFAAGQQKSAVTDLWVPGMSAVERIELQAVGYSDGSTWKVAENASCQVAPDPLMLISGR